MALKVNSKILKLKGLVKTFPPLIVNEVFSIEVVNLFSYKHEMAIVG